MQDQAVNTALPDTVQRVLDDIVAQAREALGPTLKAVVLFGSAAESRLRATSDVNVIFVLSAFERARIDPLRQALRSAEAAIKLAAMFIVESELPAAAEAFAGKFSDILRRRRVLFGEDPFTGIVVPRAAAIFRHKQIMLNLILRLREQYALRSLREEQLALVIADAAAPLRASAAGLLELRGEAPLPPREALERFVKSIDGAGWTEVLAHLSQARETRGLKPGVAGETLSRLIDLAQRLRACFETVK